MSMSKKERLALTKKMGPGKARVKDVIRKLGKKLAERGTLNKNLKEKKAYDKLELGGKMQKVYGEGSKNKEMRDKAFNKGLKQGFLKKKKKKKGYK